MDALLVLGVFALLVTVVWALGAVGLAQILLGAAVVTAGIELITYLKFRQTHPERSTVSKEMGQLYQASRARFWLVCGLVLVSTLGLLWHFYAMGR